MNGKKILYIVGCGRSGTTILGFAFGNIGRAIDLGEVRDFVKFRGKPNGFESGTENYHFWTNVLHDVESRLGTLDFERLAVIQERVDTHISVVKMKVFGERRDDPALKEYRRFLRVLYDRLLEDSRFDVIVDSSKYPSRLEHLLKIYGPEKVCVIHVVRNPVDLAEAFQKGEQSTSKPKSFVKIILYALLVNVLAERVGGAAFSRNYSRLYFEDFLAQPEQEVHRVATIFGLDAVDAVRRIRLNEPLVRGYIFNGNRMRTQEYVRLARSAGVAVKRSRLDRLICRIFAALFGAPVSTL